MRGLKKDALKLVLNNAQIIMRRTSWHNVTIITLMRVLLLSLEAWRSGSVPVAGSAIAAGGGVGCGGGGGGGLDGGG